MNAAWPVASAAAHDLAGLPVAAGYIDAKSFAALSLAPLVAVARAHAGVHDRQMRLVLTWGREAGLREGQAAYHQVEHWLANAPVPELLAAWKTYDGPRLSLVLTPEAKRELKLQIWNRATSRIQTSGAFSGICHTPPREEQAVMDEIDTALS